MTGYSIHISNLNGIDLHDYYYPNWVGCAGFIFRYKSLNQDFLMFSMPCCYLEDIFDILIDMEINTEIEILNKYLEGGGMIIDDEVLDNPWVIKDKDILINSLKQITEDKLTQWLSADFTDISIFDLDERKLLLEVIRNLILFLLDSQEREVELIYI